MDNIEELEQFYSDKTGSLRVTPYAHIECLKTFSEGHLAVVKHNINKDTHKPYLNRLHYVKRLIEGNN
jgi:hypothetical protein